LANQPLRFYVLAHNNRSLSVPVTSWHMFGESVTPPFPLLFPIDALVNFSQLSHLEPQTNLSTTFEMNAPTVAVQRHIDSPNGNSIRKWLAKCQANILPLPRPSISLPPTLNALSLWAQISPFPPSLMCK